MQPTVERLNPITGTVASRATAAGIADVDAVCAAAAAALPGWAALGPNARRSQAGIRSDLIRPAAVSLPSA